MEKNCVKMPPDDLRKLQLIQLDMLKEVDRVCKKNNIKYCIIAGTLLGAVRHKGYIPWDDDADVAMVREEYEKFRMAVKNDLESDKFFFQDYKNTENYRWGYGKIRRKNTECIRLGQEHINYPTGVFIDVFPLDNVPDNCILRGFHNFVCTIIRKFLWSEVGKVSEKNSIKRFFYKIMAYVSKEKIFKKYEKLVQWSNKKVTKRVRILTFPTPKKKCYGYFRKWYEELEDISFENYLFPAPKDYDEYLTFKFGEYLKLPPEKERCGHAYSKYNLLD